VDDALVLFENGTSGGSYYVDSDDDGFLDRTPTEAIYLYRAGEAEALFSTAHPDCDDHSAIRHPEVPEMCNSMDDNCHEVIDEGGSGDGRPDGSVEVFYDDDEDGYGVPADEPLVMWGGTIALLRFGGPDSDDPRRRLRRRRRPAQGLFKST
jgi:hypothetical protein